MDIGQLQTLKYYNGHLLVWTAGFALECEISIWKVQKNIDFNRYFQKDLLYPQELPCQRQIHTKEQFPLQCKAVTLTEGFWFRV